MSNTYTAIDFETANQNRNSICEVGLVRIENGLVKRQITAFVQPPNNAYTDFHIKIHGIHPSLTANKPTFPTIWKLIEPFIKNQDVVAHNGFSFDFYCLDQTLEYYKIPPPKYRGHCTYQIYGDNLATLCEKYKITLDHHSALSDARACGELFGMYLKKN